MSKVSRNHGEGNPEAADKFNQAEQAFIRSVRGRKRIAEGPGVAPEEEADLERAERAGRDRAQGEDPLLTRQPKR